MKRCDAIVIFGINSSAVDKQRCYYLCTIVGSSIVQWSKSIIASCIRICFLGKKGFDYFLVAE